MTIEALEFSLSGEKRTFRKPQGDKPSIKTAPTAKGICNGEKNDQDTYSGARICQATSRRRWNLWNFSVKEQIKSTVVDT